MLTFAQLFSLRDMKRFNIIWRFQVKLLGNKMKGPGFVIVSYIILHTTGLTVLSCY